jgi:hypothetical protein
MHRGALPELPWVHRLRHVRNAKTVDKVDESNEGVNELVTYGSIRRNDAEAPNEMKRKLILLAAISLGGCSPNQARDVTVCRAEADRFYQAYNTVDADNPRSRYIIACMADKGYAFDISPADCDSRHPLPTQAACYTSNSWLARIIDQTYALFTKR